MSRRVKDLTLAEQEELVNAVVAGYHALARLDETGLRVVSETSLVELVSKKGFTPEVVREVIYDICVIEEGVVLGLKG